jgi:hypothetical protein
MNDDEDIATTMAALPDGGGAPKSDDEDIADTLASLDTPHAPAVAPKTPLKNMPYAAKLAAVESSGNAHAKNPNSSATGLGQFESGTWLPLIKKNRPDLARGKSDSDLLAMRNDPDLSSQMMDAYAAENGQKLAAAGIPVNDATKYGAHWFGPDAYAKIHNAPPTTPIEKIIGANAAKNNGLAGKTTDDVKMIAANRMGSDYVPDEKLGWGDTASLAAHNLLPSVGHAFGGIYDAVRHPIDTAETLKKIGVGLDSKIESYMGHDQDPKQKAKDEELVDALATSYGEKYGTIDGFKQYLAHDPAGVLFDASTALGLGEFGAGKLASVVGKVSGTAGDAIAGAGNIAGTAGRAINPINPGGVFTSTARKIVSSPAVFDSTGNVVPKVDALIRKVTDNKMSGSDLIDPGIKTAFASSIAQKGLSEASVREGLLKSLGAEAPTSMVTQSAPPVAAKARVAAAIDANNETLTKAAFGVAGPAAPGDLAAALDKAHTQSMNSASAAYGKIRTLPGSFGAQMPQMGDLGAMIKNRFDRAGIPTADIQTLVQSGHPQAANAIKLLQSTWGSGRTLLRGPVNSNEILAMRKALNNFRSAASGSDIKAVGDITDAFDQHLANQAGMGKFVDAKGRPVMGLGRQIKAANTAYRTHFNTFETPDGANNGVVNAVRKLKSGQGRTASGALMPSGDPDLYAHAQAALAKDLLHPTKGAHTYNQLAAALGGNTAPIDDLVKGALLHGDMKNAGDLLSKHPVAQRAFSPDDLSRAKHIQAARDITNAKPSPESRAGSVLGDIAGRTLWKGLASLAGEHFGGTMGAILGPTVVEPTMERLGEARAAKAAMAGAPNTSGWLARTGKRALKTATNPAVLAVEHYSQDKSIQRASGGKVDSDALVERLIQRWKQAKKATDKTTEPLLKVPDETIIKALNIAQEHI